MYFEDIESEKDRTNAINWAVFLFLFNLVLVSDDTERNVFRKFLCRLENTTTAGWWLHLVLNAVHY